MSAPATIAEPAPTLIPVPDPVVTDELAATTESAPLVTDELLVEEISIDGMCGVY